MLEEWLHGSGMTGPPIFVNPRLQGNDADFDYRVIRVGKELSPGWACWNPDMFPNRSWGHGYPAQALRWQRSSRRTVWVAKVLGGDGDWGFVLGTYFCSNWSGLVEAWFVHFFFWVGGGLGKTIFVVGIYFINISRVDYFFNGRLDFQGIEICIIHLVALPHRQEPGMFHIYQNSLFLSFSLSRYIFEKTYEP